MTVDPVLDLIGQPLDYLVARLNSFRAAASE